MKIRNLALGTRETDSEEPEVGDEIVSGPGQGFVKHDFRRWLAVYIGPDIMNLGSHIWLAWDEVEGKLFTVSIGYFWIIREVE